MQLDKPKKSLGQHWLHDVDSLEAMCQAADVSSGDVVVEIGPGLGTLTELLVARADRVVAIELDSQLARRLPDTVKSPKLEVYEKDILRFDFTVLPANYKVVANIPYYLTSNLIRVLSESANPPAATVLLVQKEVAERVAAEPGDMSILSVTAQFYWQVSLNRVVKAELFTPPPKVDSQILALERRRTPLFPDIDSKLYFRIVKAGFSQKRKTLLNSLGAGMRLSRPAVTEILKTANISPGSRAQMLSLEDWYRLYLAFNELSTF